MQPNVFLYRKATAMAVGVVIMGRGVSQDRYEQVLHRVLPDNRLAAGMIYHAAGMTEDGLCVTEIWESQEALDQFFNEKLGQALQEAKIDIKPVTFQVVNIIDK
jgi:hypothetical protein